MKNLVLEIDNITKKFLTDFGELTDEQMNWKVNSDTWSIAQNLEHLIKVNESYFPVLDSLRAGNYKIPFLARFDFIVLFFGKTILKAVHPNRRKKMKTFSIWEPSINKVEGDVLKRFEIHQEELKGKTEESEEFVEKGVVISSPANRKIVYKLETAFDIIISHEKRHFEQAKEMLSYM